MACRFGYGFNSLVGFWLVVFCFLLFFPSAFCADPPPRPGFVPDLAVYSDEGGLDDYAVVVEKASQHVFLFSFENGSPVEAGRWRCTTGENHGRKSRAGDKKTPEGIYFFTDRYTDGDLAPIYGAMAFPTDYPNLLDRLAGRNGSAIWMHGTNKVLKDYDSNGCVALEDESITELSRYVRLNRTPIVIVEKIEEAEGDGPGPLEEKARKLLHDWNWALSHGSYHEYLALYDDSYLPDMDWWGGWRRLRDGFAKAGLSVETRSSSLYAVRYHNDYVIFFDQAVAAGGSLAAVGKKKLFLSDLSGALRIVGDTYVDKALAVKKGSGSPLLIAGRRLHEGVIVERDVRDMLKLWLAAWSNGDIEAYGSFYCSGFRSDGMNKKQWLDYKRRLSGKYRYVRVAMEDLNFLERSSDLCRISFVQKYDSDVYSDIGLKTLVIKREEGKWKIYRETWERLDRPQTTGRGSEKS